MDETNNITAGDRQQFWRSLEAKLDFSQSRPLLKPDYEQVRFTDRQNKEYYILRSPAGTGYVKLGTNDYFLFSLIDGQRTVQQILVEYFKQYGTLAFSRLGTLVRELFQGGFLAEEALQFYQRLHIKLRASQPLMRILDIIRSLPTKQWPIPKFDARIFWLYRHGFRFFFAKPVQIAAAAVSLAGFVAFVSIIPTGRYSLLKASGSVALGLAILVVLNYVAIITHELSHALACKHYRRKVNSGGTMLYMGLPAFYVDTTDAWMLGKKQRMLVSAIGPFTQSFLAGLSAGLIWLLPGTFLQPFLYKFAFLSYLSIFLNLNPFLELDGYYLLIDWLELPGLRDRANHFVRKELWPKLKARQRLTVPERIYSAFGLGGVAWSVLALLLAGYFWRLRAMQLGTKFLQATSHQFRLILLGLVLLALIAATIAAYRKVRQLAGFLWREFTGLVSRRPAVTAGTLLVLCLAISYGLGGVDGLPMVIASIVVLACLGALYHRVNAYYRGSNLWLVLMGILAVSACSLGIKTLPSWTHLSLYLLGSVALFAACYIQFSYSSLRRWRGWQRWLWGGLWLGLLIMVGVLPHTSRPQTLAILLSSSSFLMLLSLVWNNQGSSLEYFWFSFLLMVCAWDAVLLFRLVRFATIAALLGLFAVLWLYLIIKSTSWLPEAASYEAIPSERRRMRQAAVKIYRFCRGYFAAFFGEAQARAMDDRLNLRMIERGWPVRLAGSGSEERFERSTGIVERSLAFRGLLDETKTYVTHEAGTFFAQNAFRTAYESLYWEEREIAQEYLMAGCRWAEGLVIANLKKERNDAQNVIAGVARFWELTDEEARVFSSRLKEERKHPGDLIIRQGDQGDKFYIIKSGQVEVTVRQGKGPETVLAVLAKGDYFGEIALVKKVPRTATVRATSECSLLVLEKADFEQLMAQRINIADKIDRLIENRGFLARLPLFSEFAPAQIAMAASRLVPERYQPGQTVISQDEMGDSFYIIREGLLEVAVAKDGQQRMVAELGPGEYFGEIALLLDVPRTASVKAAKDSLVLRLHKDDFKSLLGEHLYFAKSLEQASSRRLSDTRHKTIS